MTCNISRLARLALVPIVFVTAAIHAYGKEPKVVYDNPQGVAVSRYAFGIHVNRLSESFRGGTPIAPAFPDSFGVYRIYSVWTTDRHGIKWRHTHRAPGEFDWAGLDRVMATIPPATKVELVLQEPPQFARDTAKWNGEVPEQGMVPVLEGPTKEYLRAVLRRYGKRIFSIDPANEFSYKKNLHPDYSGGPDQGASFYRGPVSALALVIKWTREVLDEQGLSGTVLLHAPSGTGNHKSVIELIDRHPDVASRVDSFAFHNYNGTHLAPNPYGVTLFTLQKELRKRGIHKPIWDTEHGWGDWGSRSDQEIVTTVCNTFYHHLINGISGVFFYRWDDVPETEPESWMGNPGWKPAVRQGLDECVGKVVGKTIVKVVDQGDDGVWQVRTKEDAR